MMRALHTITYIALFAITLFFGVNVAKRAMTQAALDAVTFQTLEN